MKTYSFAFVVRGDAILMLRQRMDFRAFFTLPGGEVKEDEDPKETAKRNLYEICDIKAECIKILTVNHKLSEVTEYVYLFEDDKVSEPKKMKDSTFEDQSILNVQFVKFDLLSERDKAYLYSCGILEVPGFREKLFQKL